MVVAAPATSALQQTATPQSTATTEAAVEPTSAPETGAIEAETPAPAETPEVNRDVPPEVRQEVSDAFKHYLEVRAQAFLEIDSSHTS
jgi:hypothetical protein